MLMGDMLFTLLNMIWRGTCSAVGIKSCGGLMEHHGEHEELSLERNFPSFVHCQRGIAGCF